MKNTLLNAIRSNNNFKQDVDNSIKFINSMSSNLESVIEAQKNIAISLIVNTLAVDIVAMYYLKKYI